MAVDARGMSVKFVLSEGGAADCLFAEALIADTTAGKLLADKGHDTDAIRNLAVSLGMDAVIPPKANRKEQLHCLLTVTCTVTVIWWGTVFWISNVGGVLPRVIQRNRLRLRQQ
jgi:hypothetical protein